MLEYEKMDVIYTEQFPFNHFTLDENKYIDMETAKKKFEMMQYFEAVYFQEGERIFCIDFEITCIRVTIYKNSGPYYKYEYELLGNSYKKIFLSSISIKNIFYNLASDGFAYVRECINFKKYNSYIKKYSPCLKKEIALDFGDYKELLNSIQKIDIVNCLEECRTAN